jgi:hypothetical protein
LDDEVQVLRISFPIVADPVSEYFVVKTKFDLRALMELYQAHETAAMLAKVCVVYIIFHSRANVLEIC